MWYTVWSLRYNEFNRTYYYTCVIRSRCLDEQNLLTLSGIDDKGQGQNNSCFKSRFKSFRLLFKKNCYGSRLIDECFESLGLNPHYYYLVTENITRNWCFPTTVPLYLVQHIIVQVSDSSYDCSHSIIMQYCNQIFERSSQYVILCYIEK